MHQTPWPHRCMTCQWQCSANYHLPDTSRWLWVRRTVRRMLAIMIAWLFFRKVIRCFLSTRLDFWLALDVSAASLILFSLMVNKLKKLRFYFCRAMLCKRGLSRHAVSLCVCVCVSATFMDCVKTNKHVFKIFPPSGSHTILVFLYQTSWQYSDGNPSKGGVECRWGRQKSRFWANFWLIRMLWTLRRRAAINAIVGRYLAIDRCLLELVLSTDVRLSSGVSQSRCKSVYDTENHAYTPKRRERNLIYAEANLTRECN